MAIDLLSERLLTLQQAAEFLPRLRRGRKVHPHTLYRWISTGVRGVRLDVVRVGRTLVTSVEGLQRFAVRLASGPAPGATEAGPAVEAAERELDRRGL